ncbi:MAG: hypothetical protein Q7S87_08960 [Agitococcus sp.]|nr:hypothetical protein [Agitococcus sp.]MDO9177030.1 hypothetical protein [Agitococcus sp.]
MADSTIPQEPVKPEVDPCLAMVHALQRVTPSLWSKVDVAHATLQEQRLKLLALLGWFGKKNGWAVLTPVPQRYPDMGRHVAGRLGMELTRGSASIRLDVAFDISKSLALKLRAASQQGARVLLVTNHPDGRAEVTRQLAEPTPWLHVASKLPRTL